MAPMTDDLEQRLAAAADALREHDMLKWRRTSLADRIAAIRTEIDKLRTRVVEEQADVDRLEKLSMTRILASLKGSRDDDLAFERAQADAERYKLADAQSRLKVLIAEDDAAASSLSRLVDAPAVHRALMIEKEARLKESGSPQGRRLLQVAEEFGAVQAELRELDEAVRAADKAERALAAVADSLRSAKGWSTYDTFFGGGVISSAIKHSKLDDAADLAAYADGCLAALRTELADVQGADRRLPDLAVSGGTRFVDVWFDNIFTDLSVRDHIFRSLDGVERSARVVSDVRLGLNRRTKEVRAREAELQAERARLIG
jgi:hypothetical protein